MVKETGSRPRHKVRPRETVMVPARDGVRLAADIYRPEVEGKYPALLALAVYGKDLQTLPVRQPQQRELSLVWDGTIEAGNTRYFVSRGYVHVIADVRGCGDSEGEYVGMCGPTDGQDGYDLIEWIAAQPWCDGNVGMVGISYLAGEQVYTAAEQPPHLKAIFPWEIWSDLYTQIATMGGVIYPMMYRLFSGRGMDPGPTQGSGMANNNIVSATLKHTPPEELAKLKEERLADPDLMVYSTYWSCLRYPRKSPLFADFLFHPNDGPFYHERTPYLKYDKIKVPVYTGGPWVRFWPEGACDLYNGIDAPKKLILSPMSEGDERPWYQIHDEVIRWMDYWLKGIDTGIMDEPPISVYVGGVNEWHYEKEWPLARAEWTRLYLRSRGRLMDEPPRFEEGPDAFVQQPLDETSDIKSLVYTSEPFKQATEITGPLALYLHAAIDQPDTNWQVKVYDVDGYGNRRLLTESWLKASHRPLDEKRSQPWRPRHDHTRNVPLEPGRVYDYAISVTPVANVFMAGHSVAIEIACMDDMPGGLHLCSSRTTLHRIYHDPAHASYLYLPVIPKG